MAQLTAEVAGRCSLHHLVLGDLGRRWEFESRVHVFATAAVRTEAGQVVGAQHSTNVSMSTVWSVPAEASVVPRAVLDLTLGVYVQEGTLLVVAGVEPRVEVALGHLGHVELVQELALVALLAEATQPVLANDGPVAPDVPERATGPFITVHAVHPVVELTHGRSGLWKGKERGLEGRSKDFRNSLTVHSGKWKRQRPILFVEVAVYLKHHIVHVRYQQIHRGRSGRPG